MIDFDIDDLDIPKNLKYYIKYGMPKDKVKKEELQKDLTKLSGKLPITNLCPLLREEHCNLYRGISLYPSHEYDRQFFNARVGDIIDFTKDGLLSWTTMYNVAENFAVSSLPSFKEQGGISCMLILKLVEDDIIYGIDLRLINRNETEVLLAPMKFVIIHRVEPRQELVQVLQSSSPIKDAILKLYVRPENSITTFVMNFENDERISEEKDINIDYGVGDERRNIYLGNVLHLLNHSYRS
jgi:hypothetical protein